MVLKTERFLTRVDRTTEALLSTILEENPHVAEILGGAPTSQSAKERLRAWLMGYLELRPEARAFSQGTLTGPEALDRLGWAEVAAIRLLDYLDHAGQEFRDPNFRNRVVRSDPIEWLWQAVSAGAGSLPASPDLFEDLLELFRQLGGRSARPRPDRETVEGWMSRYPSGQEARVVALREANRERILRVLIAKMEAGELRSKRYNLPPGLSATEKLERALEWWRDFRFHLRFAVRTPELLNELLDHSLDLETMTVLRDAKEAGIPFFVNPYNLSLLNVRAPDFAEGADLAIRDYLLYSRQLIEQFGRIIAWEKEDVVEPGKPNAAGWVLPTHHAIHRRYPEVAILIPSTRGRACGGLCASCQRMYNFQAGHLNFDLDRLAPGETFETRLQRWMSYFRDDSQLRDILITGGDALMSSDRSLQKIFAAVLTMVAEKREANRHRAPGQKFAEMLRVRLGTRLPVVLPQRITAELAEILASFRREASALGVKQFVIQTHFESPMEVTPEAREGIRRLLGAGWMVTNQLVFTASASRRGHTAKLREVLGEVGVLPYRTFTVKGFLENWHSFTPNARSVQERSEEKVFGTIPEAFEERVRRLPEDTQRLTEEIRAIRADTGLPFLATDRNVLNLPGVGKSMTYRVIGITPDGRRILEFDHDPTRRHSPIIEKMGKVVVIESKSTRGYLDQLERMGEEVAEYQGLWGYSLGATEPQTPVYDYPDYDFEITDELTNLELD